MQRLSMFSTEAKAVVNLAIKPDDKKELTAYLNTANNFLQDLKDKSVTLEQVQCVLEHKQAGTLLGKSFRDWIIGFMSQRNEEQSFDDFIKLLPNQYQSYKKSLLSAELKFSHDTTAEKQFRDTCEKLFNKAKAIVPFSELIAILKICNETQQSIDMGCYGLDVTEQQQTLAAFNNIIKKIHEDMLEQAMNVFVKRIDLLMLQKISPYIDPNVLSQTLATVKVNEEKLRPGKIHSIEKFLAWINEELLLAETGSYGETVNPVEFVLALFKSDMFYQFYCRKNSAMFSPEQDQSGVTVNDELSTPLLQKEFSNLLSSDEILYLSKFISKRLKFCAISIELEELRGTCYKACDVLDQTIFAKQDLKKYVIENLNKVIQLVEDRANKNGEYLPQYGKRVSLSLAR